MLNTFTQFLADDQGWDMYVTGRAGTGKTTGLAQLIEYCTDDEIDYTVCAFTHKACNILRSALPMNANVRTLHSFLKKRPTINTDASSHRHVEVSRKHGDTEKTAILFIDEYSMVGERDLMDIRDAQDSEAEVKLKVVWLGDPYQLPPVGDAQAVQPYGKYQVSLTKVYRQAADNPLMETLGQLVSFIEGGKPEPLIESAAFTRKQDIAGWYKHDRKLDNFDGIMLAYTNKRVQSLNALAQGREVPKEDDKVFCVSNRQFYTLDAMVPSYLVYEIAKPYGNDSLALNSKYKTLEHLLRMQCCEYMNLIDEDDNIDTFAVIFGHHNYKVTKEVLIKAAADSNRAIEMKHRGVKAAAWAKVNSDNPLAKTRAKAWRDFLTFNDCVVCVDFTHAMTIHKSQGSTYSTVYLDTEDLAIAAEIDYTQYLKLMYVAISRARNYVITT